jgi:hypothetical protein
MPRKSRRHTRASASVPGRMLGVRGSTRGTVQNLYNGGLFFAGKHLNVGERTELELDLEGTPDVAGG